MNALELPGYIDGIDISQVQRIDSAEAVAEAGFTWAFIKASEGASYCDPRAQQHLEQLGNAGLLVGIYAFARVGGDPAQQARKAIACAGHTFRLVVVCDLESAPAEWTAERLTLWAEAFCAEVVAQGHRSVFYTYTSFAQRMQPALARSSVLAAVPLWIAQYRSLTEAWAPSSAADLAWVRTPAPWAAWTMWQYSGNKGYRVPGIPMDCDRNLFRGSTGELRSLFGMPWELPSPMATVWPAVPLGRPALDD